MTISPRLHGLLISAGFTGIRVTYAGGPVKGLTSILTSAITAILPFDWLNAIFPASTFWKRLQNLQTTFLRQVLIVGEKIHDDNRE